MKPVPHPDEAFTVLVNSSDGYRDCWHPFFTLLARYWPTCPAPVVLNTLAVDWEHPAVPVRTTRVEAVAGRRLTWSAALLAALDVVTTPLVLYMQEDYFLEAPVDDARVRAAAALMLHDPRIAHIELTLFPNRAPFVPWADDPAWTTVGARNPYRLTTQAGLWRVDALRSFLHPEENGWQFEIFGTWRSRASRRLFLAPARDGRPAPVPYAHAGVVKGRWVRSTVELLAREGVPVDASVRGYWEPSSRIAAKLETIRKLASRPDRLVASFVQGIAGRS